MDMNESLTSSETANETKLFGLPRPIAGTLIGIGLFLLLAIILWLAKSEVGFVILFSLGFLIRSMMSPWTNTATIPLVQNVVPAAIIISVSITPPALLGLFMASKRKRTLGIIMLILYLIISMAIGSSIYTEFSP